MSKSIAIDCSILCLLARFILIYATRTDVLWIIYNMLFMTWVLFINNLLTLYKLFIIAFFVQKYDLQSKLNDNVAESLLV